MEDDIPKNTIIYDYADKYPEDVPKLLEFFESRKNEDDTRRKDTYAFIRRQDPNKEAEKRIFNEYIKYGLENLTPDINTDEEGCLLCRKSWESTQNMQKITLLCNHIFHTACFFSYYDHYTPCPKDGCGINSVNISARIGENNRDMDGELVKILISKLKTNPDFKNDLKTYKASIRKVSGAMANHNKYMRLLNKNVIKKHLYTINQIQSDINDAYSNSTNTRSSQICRKAVRQCKKHAKVIFDKYHISGRELRNEKLVKMNWRLTSVLEYHRHSYSNRYNFRIRINPGRKQWIITDDAVEEDVVEEDDVEEDQPVDDNVAADDVTDDDTERTINRQRLDRELNPRRRGL